MKPSLLLLVMVLLHECRTCNQNQYFCKQQGEISLVLSNNCQNYTISCSAYSTCIQCFQNNKKTTLQTLLCPHNCRQCTIDGICLTCQKYYYLQNEKNICQNCSSVLNGCQECSNGLQCTSCYQGYYLSINYLCLKCGHLCRSCDSRYSCLLYKPQNQQNSYKIYYNYNFSFQNISTEQKLNQTVNYSFLLCEGGCRTCSSESESKCTSCEQGLIFNGSVCLINNQFCRRASNRIVRNCQNCEQGYYLQNGKCEQCPPNCLLCNSSQSCQLCPIGHYTFNGVCVSCISNCIECNNNSTCFQCSTGFIMHDYQCLQCPLNCPVCDSTNLTNCLRCSDHYYLNKQAQCQPCPSNCISCPNKKCIRCFNNYHMNDGECIQDCELPCLECAKNNPTLCTNCFRRYILSNGTCKPDPQCDDYSICQSCYGNKTINQTGGGKTCVDIQIENCILPSQHNYQACGTCVKGFYNSNGKCIKCPSNCLICNSFKTCEFCADGFTQSKGLFQGICLQCKLPCKTCTYDPEECKECIEGYEKKGWKCVLNNSLITFKITLQTNMTYFIKKARQFSIELLKQLNYSDISKISFTNITSGSVIVQGFIETPKGSTAQESSNLLSTTLQKSPGIAGIKIQSASFPQSKPKQEEEEEKRTQLSLGIISAIVVGSLILLCVIILAIIIIVRKRKQEANQQQRYSTGNGAYATRGNQDYINTQDRQDETPRTQKKF